MLKSAIINRLKLATLILLAISLSSSYTLHSFLMWQKATTLSNAGSTSLSVFIEAANWLSKRLRQNELALVPMSEVFYAVSPQLRDKLIDYKSLWDSSGVDLRADTTKEEVLKVRNYFTTFLKENAQVRYVVRDWVDPYARRLYETTTDNESMFLLREVETMPFTLSNGWGSQIIIYERMQFTTLFAMKFSSPPKQYFTDPPNAAQFDSNGATIEKASNRVSFYLTLEVGINASKQNYLTMQFKLDVENVKLIIGFYYDKNGDGKWTDYNTDGYSGVAFNQTQQSWVKGEWYQVMQIIPNVEYPIVQIAVIAEGETHGTLTLANLVVHTA